MAKKNEAWRSEEVWLNCSSCGGSRTSHSILHQHRNDIRDYDGDWSHTCYSEMVQCNGCKSVKLRKYIEAPDENTGYHDTCISNHQVYPDDTRTHTTRLPSIVGLRENDNNQIPETVHKMYMETLQAYDARVKTLAGVGLRAIVEAICVDLGMKQRTLDKKIKRVSN
ncbi:MAG: hypothetical protein U0871_04125 [Gemmataceae bacterium]